MSVGDYAFQSKSVAKMRSILRGGATVIFVSHNLRAMADMCARSLLLRRGQIVEDGPTPHVIRTYMEQIREARKLDTERDVVIESVDVRAVDGEKEPGNFSSFPDLRAACKFFLFSAAVFSVNNIKKFLFWYFDKLCPKAFAH